MKLINWLDQHFEELFIGIFSAVMVFVIALQVFMRFVMDSSLSWSEELARYCFIWLVFLGVSYAVKKQQHMKVDALLLLVKDKWKIALGMAGNLLFLAFAVFIIFYGYNITVKVFEWGQLSPALNMPIGFVYLAGPIGMGLTAIRLIQQLVQQSKLLIRRETVENPK